MQLPNKLNGADQNNSRCIGMEGAILIGRAVLIICISYFRNHRDYGGKKTNYCLNFKLSLRNDMDPDKYFSGHNLKNAGRK